jgi:hypothetical protein
MHGGMANFTLKGYKIYIHILTYHSSYEITEVQGKNCAYNLIVHFGQPLLTYGLVLLWSKNQAELWIPFHLMWSLFLFLIVLHFLPPNVTLYLSANKPALSCTDSETLYIFVERLWLIYLTVLSNFLPKIIRSAGSCLGIRMFVPCFGPWVGWILLKIVACGSFSLICLGEC